MLSPITAITAQKVAVEIIHEGSDSIGSRVIYQIKEGIRSSGGLRLSTTDEPKYIIYIISKESGLAKNCSIIGVSITFSQANYTVKFYLNSIILECGENKIKQAAEIIISTIDETITKLLKLQQNYKQGKKSHD
jgi:phage-related protein